MKGQRPGFIPALGIAQGKRTRTPKGLKARLHFSQCAGPLGRAFSPFGIFCRRPRPSLVPRFDLGWHGPGRWPSIPTFHWKGRKVPLHAAIPCLPALHSLHGEGNCFCGLAAWREIFCSRRCGVDRGGKFYAKSGVPVPQFGAQRGTSSVEVWFCGAQWLASSVEVCQCGENWGTLSLLMRLFTALSSSGTRVPHFEKTRSRKWRNRGQKNHKNHGDAERGTPAAVPVLSWIMPVRLFAKVDSWKITRRCIVFALPLSKESSLTKRKPVRVLPPAPVGWLLVEVTVYSGSGPGVTLPPSAERWTCIVLSRIGASLSWIRVAIASATVFLTPVTTLVLYIRCS